METRVTAQSQSFRLVERMQEAKVRHGQEVRVDLPNVGVIEVAGAGEAEVRFCAMGPVRVREVLDSGDDRALPTEVALEGLIVPVSGSYDILNARVSSNGDIHVVVDDQTSVTRVARPASRVDDFEWEAMTHG